jgi:hypothetical protein
MTATAPDAGAAFDLRPLPPEALPAAVQKLLAGPAPPKLMAAKGIAPFKPAELLLAVYQLTFEADPAVKAAAEAAPAALPDKIVTATLGEALPPAVLHFFALRLPAGRVGAFEKILYNPAAADPTFAALAARLAERELEIIAQNEARVLRCPAILEALYMNPAARMSSVNRLIELCARNGVRVDAIPAFDEVARSIAADGGGGDPAADDLFAAAISADAPADAAGPGAPAGEDEELLEAVAEIEEGGEGPEAPPPPAAPAEKSKKSPIIDFTKLKLHEKIRLATLGNEYCRQNLVRDPNRVVALAAIRSPRITDAEIVKTAGNRQVCEDVIRYIANQRDFVKQYSVRHSLVLNPKCPLAVSLKFLTTLHADDLKTLARSKNVPSALSTSARRLMTQRGGQGGGGGG